MRGLEDREDVGAVSGEADASAPDTGRPRKPLPPDRDAAPPAEDAGIPPRDAAPPPPDATPPPPDAAPHRPEPDAFEPPVEEPEPDAGDPSPPEEPAPDADLPPPDEEPWPDSGTRPPVDEPAPDAGEPSPIDVIEPDAGERPPLEEPDLDAGVPDEDAALPDAEAPDEDAAVPDEDAALPDAEVPDEDAALPDASPPPPDPCALANGGCSANATCTPTGPDTNDCDCHEGFEGDGVTCIQRECQTCQLLIGSVSDPDGHPIPGNGHHLNMKVRASNAAGTAESNVNSIGNFVFYVPAGEVEVRLANPGYGFFSRNDRPNPNMPWYVWDLEPRMPWTEDDGPLHLTLPAPIPVIVHVTSGGEPVEGAQLQSDQQLTTTPFELRPATATADAVVTTARFKAGQATTDAYGDARFVVWPTAGQTFDIRVTKRVHGVDLTTTVAGVPTEAGTVEAALPPPPQLLTGTLSDTNGDPIPGNGHHLNLKVRASNAAGVAESNVDRDGNFAFHVPAGDVLFQLANPGYGFFSRNDQPNPHVPWYVWDIQPAFEVAPEDGPLHLTLPAAIPVIVHVTSGGEPVEGAQIQSDDMLTTTPFELRPATATADAVVTTARFKAGQATSDAHGDARLVVWPTAGQTFSVRITKRVHGVDLTTTVAGVPTEAGTIEAALPPPPQLLTGTLSDTNGDPIPGNGHHLNLKVRASNAAGVAESNVDRDGNFAFHVPAGDVLFQLANPGYGFFSRNDQPNPHVPWYVWDIQPAFPWTEDDGPLHLTLPAVVPVEVYVTHAGQPVQGAHITGDDRLTSIPFELRPATATADAVVTTASFKAGVATTDADGRATMMIWPTEGQTFTLHASRSFDGVSLQGRALDIPADGQPQEVEIMLGE